MNDENRWIELLDSATLEPLARQATGHENLRLEGWQVQEVSGGRGGGLVQRISGMGQDGSQPVPWSLVLKTVTAAPAGPANPHSAHYWKREPLYYRSGLLADLPDGLRAPRCYGCREREGSCQIFLEDLQDAEPGLDWPVETYREVARSLGQFNGVYLAGRPVPRADWIPRRWLRAYLEDAAPAVAIFFRSLDHPILKRAYRTIPGDLLHLAWAGRHAFMDALDRLPQTFCHQDAFCRNLFSVPARDGRQLAAVDWAYSGQAALGSELAALVYAGAFLGPIPVGELDRLAGLALDGYLQGLDDTGWRGDPDLVRFAFYTAVFYRYPLGTIIGDGLEGFLNEAAYPTVERTMGRPIEQVADHLADLNAWSLECYQEALRLKKVLRLA